MTLLLLYRPSRRAEPGRDPGFWYGQELWERAKPRKKKPKISKLTLQALKARKLPQTLKGLQDWVDLYFAQLKRLVSYTLEFEQLQPEPSSNELINKGAQWANQFYPRNEDARTLLVNFYLAQQAILEARQIALRREDEEALLLFMLTR